MMDFITGGSRSNVLAPRLEVGQEALYDALRTLDTKRAARIIKRVASGGSHQGSRAAGNNTTGRGIPEVRLARAREVDFNSFYHLQRRGYFFSCGLIQLPRGCWTLS